MVALKLGVEKEKKSKSNNKNSYEIWREYRKNTKENYIMVPTEVKDYLHHIHTQAINLYLYYFFRANNNTGISWPSVDRTAKDLGVSPRSINYWNEELESLGLIARISENKASKLTYLLPISNFYYLEKGESMESFLQKSDKKLDGELIYVFHFFQWRLSQEKKEYTKKLNLTYLVFKRTSMSKDGDKVKDIFKIVGIKSISKDIKEIEIEKRPDDFEKDVYRIAIPELEELEKIGVPHISLAVNTKLNLLGTKEKDAKEILQFLEQIIENFDDLEQIEEIPLAENGTSES